MDVLIIFVVLLVVAMALYALADAGTDDDDDDDGDGYTPDPLTSRDPRCARVENRLREAREEMQRRGTPLLLSGRDAWPRVSSGR